MRRAQQGLEELRKHVDTIIVILIKTYLKLQMNKLPLRSHLIFLIMF